MRTGSCGAIRSFIPELIRLGVDVLDPIQPVGPEMSPERLKAEFDAVLAASIFHYGTYTVADLKAFLSRSGIPVRCA